MKEVPFIISKKDLNMIEELLQINNVLNKKIKIYLNCINNGEIKKQIVNIMKLHKRHYKSITNILM